MILGTQRFCYQWLQCCLTMLIVNNVWGINVPERVLLCIQKCFEFKDRLVYVMSDRI